MFQYNMWSVSNPGGKFGHQEMSDEEYEAIMNDPELGPTRMEARLRECVFSLFTSKHPHVENTIDGRDHFIDSALRFYEYYGTVTFTFSFTSNHVSPDIIDRQKELVEAINAIAPASYGAAYMFSDDEPPFNGRFIRVKFVGQNIEISNDDFFDRHIPIS